MAAWITFFRGLFAVALGIALLVRPEATRPILSNFIGVFWASSGLLSIRWGLHTERSRWITILVGLVGILAGIMVLVRRAVSDWLNPDFIVTALGVIALLTGLLHVSGHMPVRQVLVGTRSRTGILLGILEMVLGTVLIFDDVIGPILHTVLIIWALLGAFALFNDARWMRQETKRMERNQAIAEQAPGVEKEGET